MGALMEKNKPPRDSKDRALKWLFDLFRTASMPQLGLDMPRVIEALPTEFVHIERRLTDALYRTENGDILHVEFQMSGDDHDLRRFAIYDALILDRYPDMKKVCTVVLYGPKAKPSPAFTALEVSLIALMPCISAGLTGKNAYTRFARNCKWAVA